MKAVYITGYGGRDVIEIKEDAPNPALSSKHGIIQVHSASINPFDVKLKAGYMKDFIPMALPFIAGGDFSGIITEVASDVEGFSKGDEVYGQAMVLTGGSGSFAEFVSSNAENMALKPTSVNFNEASALVLVGASSVQALIDHMKVMPGQKILIHGGAGGIGHVAIQIAKANGAYVATTADAKDSEFVKNIGADEVIDYKTQQFEDIIKDYDGVFDTVSGEVLKKSYQVIKKGGILVSMLGPVDEKLAQEHGITAIAQMTKTNTEHLTKLKELVDLGKVRIHIEKVFQLAEAADAYGASESHPKGKIVLEVLK